MAEWIKEHKKTLRSLYRDFLKDTGDTVTNFDDFCEHMFFECKH